MSENHIIVIAEFVFNPESIDAAKQIVLPIVAESRKDAGCWYYDFFQNGSENNQFILSEHWTNKAAWDIHLQKDYIQKFIIDISKHLQEPLKIRWFNPVD